MSNPIFVRIGQRPSELDRLQQARESSSAYNALPSEPGTADPLADLRPEDPDAGWHASRNLSKSLNHLDLARAKSAAATSLGLRLDRTRTAATEDVYAWLGRHQAKQVSTDETIDYVASISGISHEEVRALLRSYLQMAHIEFHPTDVCNLSCLGCTYGHDVPELKPPPIQYPYDQIEALARLNPRSIVLIGGGEPTLYRHSGKRFQDLIDVLSARLPDTALAITSNGTFKPPGEWPSRMRWIRLSLDAATSETYSLFRGKEMFDRVLRHYISYLEHDVPYVGVSFLFGRDNIHESADVAELMYDRVMSAVPERIGKVNIQYRPLRRDPYRYAEGFELAATEEQVSEAVRNIKGLYDRRPEMREFLRDQTNITVVNGGNAHPPHPFSRCEYSQISCIVRADGSIRPCFIRVNEPEFLIGNIMSSEPESIALNMMYIGSARQPHCDSQGCRQCHVNYVIEAGLEGRMTPSTSPDVRSDPMY